jgi:hypothetical protein
MRPTVVKQALRLGLLMAFVVLALSACGGGGGQPQQQEAAEQREGNPQPQQEEAEARTIPKPGKSLAAGTYATEAFEPALSFTVGGGWIAIIPEANDVVAIGKRDVPLSVGALNVEEVFDLDNPGETVAAPDDMAAWLQEHPYLDTEEPGRATVGGVSGQQFDAIASEPKDVEFCPEPCVPLFVLSGGETFWLGKSEKYRFIVLDDVDGETVTIIFGGPAVEFEEFLGEAQNVLETVEWKGS